MPPKTNKKEISKTDEIELVEIQSFIQELFALIDDMTKRVIEITGEELNGQDELYSHCSDFTGGWIDHQELLDRFNLKVSEN